MRALALIIALFPFPALAGLPDWWRPGAVWEGEGTQDDGQTWAVEITLAEDSATVRYPSIPCAGTLNVLGSASQTVTLRETITDGATLCVSGGTLLLRVEAGGSLIFDWSDPVTGMTAKAVLAPPTS